MHTQVLGSVFITQPPAFIHLVLEQQQQQQQQGQTGPSASMAKTFLDKWLSVASARFLEEVIGE